MVSAALRVFYYTTAPCLVGAVDADATFPFSITNAWTVVSDTFTVPPTATHVAVGLSVTKPFNADDVTVRFDNVLFKLAP